MILDKEKTKWKGFWATKKKIDIKNVMDFCCSENKKQYMKWKNDYDKRNYGFNVIMKV